ncbi:hypothetical protein glysoja_006504, partial [Glycine soja]
NSNLQRQSKRENRNLYQLLDDECRIQFLNS